MSILHVRVVNSRGVASCRIARRIASFNKCRIRRHCNGFQPFWDGTDPALRGPTGGPEVYP